MTGNRLALRLGRSPVAVVLFLGFTAATVAADDQQERPSVNQDKPRVSVSASAQTNQTGARVEASYRASVPGEAPQQVQPAQASQTGPAAGGNSNGNPAVA